MLFSQKTKGYFVEQTEHSWLLARTSAPNAPCTVEEFREVPINDAPALAKAIEELQPKKPQSGYLHATCAVYPQKRLVRRASLEIKRVKEPAYFPELCVQQFRIEPDKYTIAVLNSNDGSDYDANKATGKEVLFCGLPSDDVIVIQNAFLENGIYPERLELGSVSFAGGIIDYSAFNKLKSPTLILEVGGDATHSYIVSEEGLESTRPIPQGIDAMVPVVQKELGLKDEESAKKLFYSNTFDFTGMGPQLIKRLLKELQSSIGFYEVQTGQSIGQVICTLLPSKLMWLENTLATALGVAPLKLDFNPWLHSRQIGIAEQTAGGGIDRRWLGLLALIARYNSPAEVPDAAHVAVSEKKA